MKFERLRAEVSNWAERQLEKKKVGEGVVFIPYDRNIREVSEALLIDGALPSEINRFILDTKPKDVEIKEDLTEFKLGEIRDSMILEGADSTIINEALVASKLEMMPKEKPPLLSINPRARKVDLQAYQES
jgi:hypothetical protein